MVAKRKPVRRKGYATGGMVKDKPKSEAWIDRLPQGKDDNTFYQDRKMGIKPQSPNDDMATMPQPEGVPTWMENRKGGKVTRVLRPAKRKVKR